MEIYVISDTHFDHRAMVLPDYENRPINFNRLIVRSWNSFVRPNHMIIHLGDIELGNSSTYHNYISRLNGRKILVRGNHDKKSYIWYIKNGFDFACETFSWDYYGLNIIFSHRPIINIPKGFNVNIHGHCHTRRPDNLTPDHLLFCLENEEYKPILLSNFIKRWRRNKTN